MNKEKKIFKRTVVLATYIEPDIISYIDVKAKFQRRSRAAQIATILEEWVKNEKMNDETLKETITDK
jgi:hypothetical protein